MNCYYEALQVSHFFRNLHFCVLSIYYIFIGLYYHSVAR